MPENEKTHCLNDYCYMKNLSKYGKLMPQTFCKVKDDTQISNYVKN